MTVPKVWHGVPQCALPLKKILLTRENCRWKQLLREQSLVGPVQGSSLGKAYFLLSRGQLYARASVPIGPLNKEYKRRQSVVSGEANRFTCACPNHSHMKWGQIFLVTPNGSGSPEWASRHEQSSGKAGSTGIDRYPSKLHAAATAWQTGGILRVQKALEIKVQGYGDSSSRNTSEMIKLLDIHTINAVPGSKEHSEWMGTPSYFIPTCMGWRLGCECNSTCSAAIWNKNQRWYILKFKPHTAVDIERQTERQIYCIFLFVCQL